MNTRNSSRWDRGVQMKKNKAFLLFGVFVLVVFHLGYASAHAAQIGTDQRTKEDTYNQLVLSQRVSSQKRQQISLNLEDISLLSALDQLAKKARVGISYQRDIIPNKKITISLNNLSVFRALKEVLKGTELEAVLPYSRDVLVIRKKEPTVKKQQATVHGTVTDGSSGGTLPGVNIQVKGTTNGTSTGAEGNYSLSVESLQDTLVFSFVGYKERVVPIAGRTEIDIDMVPQKLQGQELVVVGYGTQKKSDLTGSLSSLEQKDVNKVGTVTNVTEMLQGRAAGVNITQSSSAPGGASSIRIRGATSVSTNNEPLFVVDGIPISSSNGVSTNVANFNGGSPSGNPLNTMNPNDIESIEILKGPSATAIYGARGSNGVILINTKNGKEGQVQVDYQYSFGVQSVARDLDLLSTSEYINVMNELAEARGNAKPITQSTINSVGAGTDWQNAIFRSAPVQKHNLSLSGGADNITYFVSFNYMDQDGVVKSSNLKKYVGRINLDYQENKFHFGVKLNSGVNKNDLVPTGTGYNNARATTIYAAYNAPPIFSIYDKNGDFVRPENGQIISAPVDNPLAVALGMNNLVTTRRSYGTAFGEYEILPNLEAKINAGYESEVARSDAYNTNLTISGQSTNGGATIRNEEVENTLIEATLNYKNSFKQHSIDALAGYTYQQFENRWNAENITGFPVDLSLLQTNNIGLGDIETVGLGSNTSLSRLRSYIGRINYKYADKYILTASLRADGSSNFGTNNKFGLFPSFALAWKPLEESFIPDSKIFSNLKFRASWGRTGNDQIGSGQTYATYSIGRGPIFGNSLETAIAQSRIPNPDLKWESTEQLNAGLDFGLFNDRINGSVDVYRKLTKDLLINLPIAKSTGFNTIATNIGEIENKGLELALNTHNLIGPFSWSTDFNFSTFKNEVKNLGSLSQIISGAAIARSGDPLFAYYGYKAEGIFQSEEEVAQSAQADLAEPGVPKWKDLNGDGKIDQNDRTIVGDPYPDYTFGINNTFNYKNFNLSVFIEGKQGQDLYNRGIFYALYPNDPYRNRLAEPLLNRWTPENNTNKWPSSIDPSIYQGDIVNSFTVEDASYIRLKNIQLTYNVPVSKVSFLRRASISVSSQNLAILTNYHGFDPDVNTNGSNNVVVDRNSYPHARTFLLEVNLGF